MLAVLQRKIQEMNGSSLRPAAAVDILSIRCRNKTGDAVNVASHYLPDR
jgi:hypothetical protein